VPLTEVREGLRRFFEQFGLPDAVRVDNGGPWGKPNNTPSWLALWIAGLGIEVRWIRPHTPKDNPQIERANRLIDDWTQPDACVALSEWQAQLTAMVTRQRDAYPALDGSPRTRVYPDFYCPRRPYHRQTEAACWSLAAAQRLLAQFRWQRVVDSNGQIMVMNQRMWVGRRWRKLTVDVAYDPALNVYRVAAPDGTLLRTHAAKDITVDGILSLASTRRKRRRQTRVALD
jgi:hypothetical protein